MSNIDPTKLPKHVAIIMDGNGRWAKLRMMNRVRGHEEGAESVRAVVKASRKLGIQWLTLYAFSEENWVRPQYEVRALMGLLKRFLERERRDMQENGIRLNAIGRIAKLPEDVQKALAMSIKETSQNRDMVLTLALSYGSRQEITDAFKTLAARVESGVLRGTDITEQMISDSLYTAEMPDPDFLIRTSGEFRLSNYLLWQMAYTEIYTTSTYWPDFREEEYFRAIEEYQHRERRFGATGEQVVDGLTSGSR